MMANVSDSDYPQNTTPTRENSDHVNAALISDYRNLMAHLREAVTCAKKGSSQEAETQLKLAKGIVNVTDYLEPNAKIYMTAVFAEFHAAILSQSNSVIRGDVTCDDDDSADVMFENYLQSMQFIHGENHVVMSDCYSLVSASRAIKGRYKDAIEFCGRATVTRIASVGLLHPSTAASHFNLGLLYRLQGDLTSSRKHLRLCRRIQETLHGAHSLAVAKVDISLGQTERVSCNLDSAFLHFYLSFHLRVLELGPEHADTLRAYQLVSQTRYAYKDRLVTSVELMDRMDELGFLCCDEEEDEEGADVATVMTELVNQVYAIKAATTASSTATSGDSVVGATTAGGRKVGTQASVSSKYITTFGDYVVFRQSHLTGMIRNAVAQRIAASDRRQPRQRDRDKRKQPAHSPKSRSPTHNISASSFDSMSNLMVLTEQFVALLLPEVRAAEVHTGGGAGTCLGTMSPGSRSKTSSSVSGPVSSGKNISSPGSSSKLSPASPPPPNLLTVQQQSFHSERFLKRQDSLQQKRDAAEGITGGSSTADGKTKSKMSPAALVEEGGERKENSQSSSSNLLESSVAKTWSEETGTNSKSSSDSAVLSSVTPPDKEHQAASTESMQPRTPKYGSSSNAPKYGTTPESGVKKASTDPTPTPNPSRTKATPPPKSSQSQTREQKQSKTLSPTSPQKLKSSSSLSTSYLRVRENKSNKAFYCSNITASTSPSGKSSGSKVRAVLLPPTGKRRLIISTNTEGEKITIRPTVAADILEAMKTKIYTVGIFPYLLLNDYKNIEKEEREFTSSEAVARKRAESSAPHPDDLAEPEPPVPSLTSGGDALDGSEGLSLLSADNAVAPTTTSTPGPVESNENSSGSVSGTGKIIPRPPPLPTSWPPQVENGVNVGGNTPVATGPCLPPPAGKGGAISGLFGALTEDGTGGRRKSLMKMKPAPPKRKQLHWEMLDKVEGTIWADDKDKANVDELFAEEEDIFKDCADLFAATVQKSSEDKKKNDMMSKAKNKQVAVLDGQKSQNMNIMLAKFGSRRKVSEIIYAIVALQSASFTLSTVNTMLDYTPSSFADSGEVEGIRAVVARDGVEKLGKAEAYLYELAKVPRVENYLRVLVLILSIEEMKDNVLENSAAVIKINEEVRGSVRLKVFFRAVLQVGNILNEGSKKCGAVAFKISSLSKLTQTKSNSGKTVLQYLATTLDKEMPGILDLRKDFESLEAAKHVSFPSLQLDIGKVETGMKTLVRLKEDMKKALDAEAAQKEEEEDDDEPPPDDDEPPPDDDIMDDDDDIEGNAGEEKPKKKKDNRSTDDEMEKKIEKEQKEKKADPLVTPEIYATLLQHETAIIAMHAAMKEQLALALTCHSELCTYLGEDAKTEPETIYGALISFVNAVGMAAAKRR